MDASTGQNQ